MGWKEAALIAVVVIAALVVDRHFVQKLGL